MDLEGPITPEITLDTLRSLEDHLGLAPTEGQAKGLYILSRMLDSQMERCAFLLKGYAGTGKTSMMKALVGHLKSKGERFRCLAPTGRAAKVLSRYTDSPAFTIHKQIYRKLESPDGGISFGLAHSTWKDTVFIVDEASMISEDRSLSGNDLLGDLLEYVYSNSGNRLVLLGDEAQLPPVGLNRSPALDIDILRSDFGLRIATMELTEVVRQSVDSGILDYATQLRDGLGQEGFTPLELALPDGLDISYTSPYELPDVLESAYARHGVDEVKVICRSNKDAWQYNQQIRTRVLYKEDRLEAGDRVMVVRNNYLWSEGHKELPFIANGEMMELLYLRNGEERYGLSFREAGLELVVQESLGTLDAKVMLDSLDAQGPAMSPEAMEHLYRSVREDLSYIHKGSKLKAEMQEDPYLNALQLKYGYAITCHKAQGGQWPVVIVDRGFVPQDADFTDFTRWLYTAVTRATEKLYIIGSRD